MKRIRHTPEQIIRKLKIARQLIDQGKTIAESAASSSCRRRRFREIAAEHILLERRIAYRLLRRKGWAVNHKQLHRLWREEGLQRPAPRKQKRARPADGFVSRQPAEHSHQVWAMDF